ncbi:MAG: trk system potassium uptake protein TrkH, partial [Salinirussus sp.]
SPAIQWAVVPFMIIAGTNFALFWYAVAGQPRRLLENEEFRSYLLVMVAFGVVVTGLLYAGLGAGLSSIAEGVAPIAGEVERAARHAAFQTAAIVTTTGYASMDFNTWSEAAKVLLLFAMFLGGSAGSAAGSVKIVRWLLVSRTVRRELFTTVHPEAVRPVRVDGEVLDESTLRGLAVFVLVFLLLFALTTLILFLDGVTNPALDLSALESMSAAIATVGNVGPGFGVVGPMGSYTDFSAPAKGWMVLAMWLGRLEIISVILVLTPTYWRS